MICNQCQVNMVNVGREIKPGHPEIWMDGWVCAAPRCPGYATTSYDGRESRWPALTLMGVGIHLCIAGAKSSGTHSRNRTVCHANLGKGEVMKELFSERDIKEIPPGFRVLEVIVPGEKFYCLTNEAKKAVQGKYLRSSASIWREGNRLNGCGLGSS